MSSPFPWLALLACLLSCYFAACHIALKTFSRARLQELLEEQGRGDRLEPFVAQKRNFLLMTGGVRVCLSLAVLLAIDHELEQRYPELSWVAQDSLAFVFAVVLVSVFAMAVPMSVARYYRERLLARSMRILESCLILSRPFTASLSLFDPVVRRVVGNQDEAADSDLSDEILSVVEEHENGGAVDEGQKEMIEAVVDFPTTTVGQIMTPRTDVQGIEVNLPLDEVRSVILREAHSRIPVYQQNLDHILGILYTKDLIRFIGDDSQFDLRSILRDALMVPESKPVREMLAEFKSRKVHIAIVLDEYGGTAGLVTIEDILEEIVGEIHDEYESAEDRPPIRHLDDQTVEVDARVYIDDLNDDLDLQLPEDRDYDTVGGFVFSTLGHIPVAGESFEFDRIKFYVAAAERTKVTRVRLDLTGHDMPAGGGRNNAQADA